MNTPKGADTKTKLHSQSFPLLSKTSSIPVENRQVQIQRTIKNLKKLYHSHYFHLNFVTGYFFVRSPGLIGPVLPAGNVLFPYSPILARPNRFCYLDVSCSLVVAEGDPEVIIYHLLLDVRTDGRYVPPVLEG